MCANVVIIQMSLVVPKKYAVGRITHARIKIKVVSPVGVYQLNNVMERLLDISASGIMAVYNSHHRYNALKLLSLTMMVLRSVLGTVVIRGQIIGALQFRDVTNSHQWKHVTAKSSSLM
jgi:hypothetical protein